MLPLVIALLVALLAAGGATTTCANGFFFNSEVCLSKSPAKREGKCPDLVFHNFLLRLPCWLPLP